MISTAEVSGLPQNSHGTVTGASGVSTLNKKSGVITTESLTTAAAGVYTETLTNSEIKAGDIVLATVSSTGTGNPVVTSIVVTAGQAVISIQNIAASAAFNAALVISFVVFNLN